MKQRYNELTHDLCVRAVLEGFDGKWTRNDIVTVVNKYGGIAYAALMNDIVTGSWNKRIEAAESIACEMEQRILDLMDGDSEAMDLDPVTVTERPDGMTGKIRPIAELCTFHQLYGHLIKIGLEPLLNVRIMPQQCASIPGRGQTGLKRQVERWLRKKSLRIGCAHKKDVRHAYPSLMYAVCIDLLKKEIPAAAWIFAVLQAMAEIAPGGHLIIGGYIDAWLFNFAMSYALRYVLSLRKVRRGQSVPLVVCAVTHMDDFGLLGRRMADVVSAARSLARWMLKNFGIELKPGGEKVDLLTYQEEHARKHAPTLGGRGCPGLDMGGFVMHRSYTTVRPCIYLRARRAYLRAGREVEKSGTLQEKRAHRLTAYYGYYKNTNAETARAKLGTDKLKNIAAGVIAYHERKKTALQKERNT